MIKKTILTLLLSTALVQVSAANDMIANGEIHELGYTGNMQDFVIPSTFKKGTLFLVAFGADGGNAIVETLTNHAFGIGGSGASIASGYIVGTGADQIDPGSTIRFIVGQKGASTCNYGPEKSANISCSGNGGAFAGAGGGGGTGIYLIEPGKEPVILLGAGAGGGGQAYSYVVSTSADGRDGSNASSDSNTGDSNNIMNGSAGGGLGGGDGGHHLHGHSTCEDGKPYTSIDGVQINSLGGGAGTPNELSTPDKSQCTSQNGTKSCGGAGWGAGGSPVDHGLGVDSGGGGGGFCGGGGGGSSGGGGGGGTVRNNSFSTYLKVPTRTRPRTETATRQNGTAIYVLTATD